MIFQNKDKMSCEHLSHICVLSLYVNSVQCALFMQTHMAPVKLFYNKDETSLVLNAKNITQIYSLRKDDDVYNFFITSILSKSTTFL